MKLLPSTLFEKYIYVLASEMTSPRNQNCANCIGTLSFPMSRRSTCVAFACPLTGQHDLIYKTGSTLEKDRATPQ